MVCGSQATTPILRKVLPVERLVYSSAQVCLGEFRCEPSDPLFGGGACSGHTIVFPRTAVWIRHDGCRRRLIDASVITFYNQDQAYERWPVRDPDRCDWLAFPDATVREAVAAFDPAGADAPQGPFRAGVGPSDPQLYLRQRRLFAALHAGRADGAEVEDTAMHLLRDAVARQHADRRRTGGLDAPGRRTREGVERVRELIARDPTPSHRLESLAREAGLSVFYLCHAFRQITGSTITGYRSRLRLMASLECLTPASDLTRVAIDLGFSSHSHFTYAFRRTFGVSPSRVRNTQGRQLV